MEVARRVIITGAFRFPEGDAAAARVLGIGKALKAAGYQVEFAGWEEGGRPQDRQPNGSYEYQGFVYVSQRDLRHVPLSPIRRLVGYFFTGNNTIKWLRASDLHDVRMIVSYNGVSLFLLRLAGLCRKRKIELAFDCTEWYKAADFPGGRFGPAGLDSEFRMRWINRRIRKGIVISRYLESYYGASTCNVLIVPPLVDLDDPKWRVNEVLRPRDAKLRLVYAGTPGRKDLLGNVLRGLRLLLDQGLCVELHLIGPTREATAACVEGDLRLIRDLSDALVFHGRVSQSAVPNLLAQADFSVLLRPVERYAQAGFATKLVESLAAGVPVIANPAGDIGEFVHDGQEGILLADHSVESFVAGVVRAHAFTPHERLVMRENARMLAEKKFDFRNYVERIGEFVEQAST